MSTKGQFFVTSPEDNSVKLREDESRMVTATQDKRLRWPDSMAEAPNGDIYVTASHIQDTRMFKVNAPVAIRTELFRFSPPR
jgi:hypothetical protein